MNKRFAACLPLALFLLVGSGVVARSQKAQNQAPAPTMTETQQKNVQEYIELLRSGVVHQKDEIMGAVMALDVDQSAKFWPIYNEYDGELAKLNDQMLVNMKEYASNYDSMTDAKADELVQGAQEYRKQRAELLAKYYGRVKESLGAVQAARFLQVEDQLLEIIDLQNASSLPIAGQGS